MEVEEYLILYDWIVVFVLSTRKQLNCMKIQF